MRCISCYVFKTADVGRLSQVDPHRPHRGSWPPVWSSRFHTGGWPKICIGPLGFCKASAKHTLTAAGTVALLAVAYCDDSSWAIGYGHDVAVQTWHSGTRMSGRCSTFRCTGGSGLSSLCQLSKAQPPGLPKDSLSTGHAAIAVSNVTGKCWRINWTVIECIV